MDKFPQEIVSSIVGHLKRSDLPSYATISRQWQYAVERLILQAVRFESTELSAFEHLFRPSESHRRTLIKSVDLHVVLPTYSDAACGEYEDDCEKEANSQVFSRAIHGLFKIFESLDDEDVRRAGGLELKIDAYSPMDTHRRPDHDRKREATRYGSRKDLWTERYQASFLQLKDCEHLPALSNVSELHCSESYHTRHIEPASVMALVAKLRNLKRCYLQFYDQDVLDLELRQINRYNLAKAVSACTQPVDDCRITFRSRDPGNEDSSPPNLLPSSSKVDLLNLALHEFIQQANVTTIRIRDHIVTPELFWPSPNTTMAPITSPFWQNLRDIHVNILVSTVDGGWYFMADPSIASYAEFTEKGSDYDSEGDDSDDNTNTFRSIPDPERMNPLLIAMAHAARHAPVLERMWLSASGGELQPRYLEQEDVELERIFQIHYLAKGMHDVSEELPDDKPTLICQVGDWKLEGEVERHWGKALSPDGVIVYNIPDY
ncbi:hypothetical protein AJ79_01889 [Helicocarpus griseus UAMH5409]|uniref:F-box domain-containing protein n=1 Tax=Helicocarpus griseus UAMH5409 TaxID=1447875 RepID=A0A2B7Y6V8_9EURO|nr:hypothetical protein AJ79_01889 [Helicocarpus griseus UAMH5409]